MFTQAYQHGLMQLLPYAGLTPLTQSSPACHPAAIAQSLRKVFPWNACAQHKQDAVEGGFITDGAAAATFAGCNERGNEGLQLLPQLFADGGAGHKAAKHKCVCSLQIAVVLAALKRLGLWLFSGVPSAAATILLTVMVLGGLAIFAEPGEKGKFASSVVNKAAGEDLVKPASK